MFRKLGRRISHSPSSSEHIREEGASIDFNDVSFDIKDDESPGKHRRSSEPARSISPSSSTSTPQQGGKGPRHASIPEEHSNNRLQIPGRSETGVADSPRLLDGLGLDLVHTCSKPLVDLIFVHGLGGTSRGTWSWQRDRKNFWPAWLSQETDLCRSRIFTLGYNAEFSGQDTPLSILDFAKDLLFRMKTYSDGGGASDQPIGQNPLVFVMHSMGGLVVKKAYIIGKSDEQYARIISQIHAMLFLATPHRGSANAEFLNNVLRTTPGLSAKTYISELEKTSTSLQDINEQFRTVCGNIKLVSFYENQKTTIGFGVKKMIVERESAVLGYPTETSTGLNADHHGICKFSGTSDPNYVQVRNALRMFFRAISLPETTNISVASKKKLEELLGILENPADDLGIIRERIMKGSCHWILQRSTYLDWKNAESGGSKILWLTGLPAVGKSVLSSFVIDSLQKDRTIGNCYYHFFKSEHQTKRTVGQMLRNIAFQIAISCEPFREKLLELYDSGTLALGRQSMNIIWEIIFEGILFRQKFDGTFFWVLDGLDEADHPEILVKFLSKLQSYNQFRILIVSRLMRELAMSFGNNIEVVHDEVSLNDTFDDIKAYTDSVLSATLHSEKAQLDVSTRVLEKAHGSFLWVTLALDQLKDNWHTQNDIGRILNDLPEGMEPLYARMMQIISEQAPRPRAITLKILTWTLCAFRPLEIAELEVALASEFGSFLSLKDTVRQICANFVIVEKSRVTLIHDTARHFLLHSRGLPAAIDYRSGNEHVASTCLKFLMNPKKNWRHNLVLAKMTQSSFDPFLPYAATWWAYHVSLAPASSDLVSLVLEFLENSCLTWIHAVSLLGDIRTLTRAAQYIKLYIRRRNRKNSNESLMSLTGNRDDELKQWAKDLIRVVGRFGSILMQSPQSVYNHIIPFCPKGSIISKKYNRMTGLSVVGISSQTWDDCLARLTMGNDQYASKVFCKGAYFITLIGSGELIVWHAESCGEARRIDHGEWISVMTCSKVSPWVVTAGAKTIRGWDIITGEEVFCLPKFYERRILALSLCSADNELLIGYDDSSIQCVDLMSFTEKWKIILEEKDDLEHPCPHMISFSPDNYRVLVGYRGRAMLAWSLDQLDREPQKFVRPEDRYGRHHDTWKAGTPECAIWRPDLPVVLIIYNDTTLFEWNIEDDIQREISEVRAQDMAISPDGNLLVTSDYSGTLKVWTVPEFQLAYQRQDNDMVRSLAFSPDGQRFYDIRGPLCNVWEPDALIRPDDLDREELSSTQDTMLSQSGAPTIEAGRVQITALVCDTEDRFYCCGKDSGAVVLHNMATGEKIRRLYGHSTVVSIVEMAWSTSSKFIASADDCGRVIVKRLRKPSGQLTSWAVYPVLDFRPGQAILQLLFSSSEEYLLASSSICALVWSLKNKSEVCRLDLPLRAGIRWINHPLIEDCLLRIDSEDLHVFSWQTLKEIRRADLNDIQEGREDDADNEDDFMNTIGMNVPDISLLNLHKTISGENLLTIERIVQVHPTQLIFKVSAPTRIKDGPYSPRGIRLIDINSSHPTTCQQETSADLSMYVDRLIGSFHGLVVFLDRHYCFCTWDLEKGAASLKKHFFLPKDWLSPGMLKLCMLNSYGTILCPKNGEVAIIRSGVKL
ncbi:NACHT and WD domain protein [Hyaloscypha hepaticicola]|uniref:NACHT and WD domain protein n=1 Tax=Hyaloscypha hepaticicola TaxID=2082293 RepID=A0A2J6PHS8_9HELO|nr:NACHT and WD domain protein [Hyaloscypha hepaticicola]